MATVVNVVNTEVVKVDRVIDALKLKQGDMSNEQFAQKLGITATMLGYLWRGERQPGMKVYNAVMREYPDLIPDVLMAMREKGANK